MTRTLGRTAGTTARLVAAVLLATSCTSGTGSKAPLFAGSPVVDVNMREFAFDYPKDIPAGQVVFRVHNTGHTVHRLAMLPLPEDLPPIDVQLRGTERRAISPFAGIYDRAPGQDGTFAAYLVPGRRYAFVCFVTDQDGSHALKGMASEFRAPGPPPATPPRS